MHSLLVLSFKLFRGPQICTTENFHRIEARKMEAPLMTCPVVCFLLRNAPRRRKLTFNYSWSHDTCALYMCANVVSQVKRLPINIFPNVNSMAS